MSTVKINNIKFIILFLFIFSVRPVVSQNCYTQYSGYVKDSLNLEPLIGATIIGDSKIGAVTDINGYFTLRVSSSVNNFEVSYVGYMTKRVKLKNGEINQIILSPSTAELEGVIITGKAVKFEPITSKVSLNASIINSIPAVAGVRDLMKSLYFLPGVNGANEGSASLIARGGNTDQNLFLIDGATLYNTGHFFNLVSVYNPDAVKKVDFYNGIFPARYGQSISSVVDVTLKEGNKSKHEGLIDIGILSSRLLYEGPLDSGQKSSYLISCRASYLDLLKIYQLDQYNKKQKDFFFGYTFLDVSSKLSFEPRSGRKYFISGYLGTDYHRNYDRYGFTENKRYTIINNGAISVRGIQHLNEHVVLSEGLHYTFNLYKNKGNDYQYFENEKYIQTNWLQDLQFNGQLTWYANEKHELVGGLNNSLKLIEPFNHKSGELTHNEPLQRSIESSLFLEDKFNLTRSVSINSGVRSTFYIQNSYSKISIEPRISVSKTMGESQSITLAYSKNTQFVHALLRNEGFKEHVIWVAATENIRPQAGNQISFTFLGQNSRVNLDYSISTYYREMKNLLWYPFTNDIIWQLDKFAYSNWEQKAITNGLGKAFGVELFLKKQFKQTAIMVSYTWSRSFRKYSNLNGGRFFISPFDRPHYLTISAEHHFNSKLKLNALWELQSGKPINIPQSKVNTNPYTTTYYLFGNLYQSRLPYYHRLDLSLVYTKPYTDGSSLTYTIGLYNAYNKFNPYGIEIDAGYIYDSNMNVIGTEYITRAVSIFPIIPSFNITYRF